MHFFSFAFFSSCPLFFTPWLSFFRIYFFFLRTHIRPLLLFLQTHPPPLTEERYDKIVAARYRGPGAFFFHRANRSFFSPALGLFAFFFLGGFVQKTSAVGVSLKFFFGRHPLTGLRGWLAPFFFSGKNFPQTFFSRGSLTESHRWLKFLIFPVKIFPKIFLPRPTNSNRTLVKPFFFLG